MTNPAPTPAEALLRLADASEGVAQYICVGSGPLGADPAAEAMRGLFDAIEQARAALASQPAADTLDVAALLERIDALPAYEDHSEETDIYDPFAVLRADVKREILAAYRDAKGTLTDTQEEER